MCNAQAYDGYGYGYGYGPRLGEAYGLGGFFGSLGRVVSAPFRAAKKVVTTAAKGVVVAGKTLVKVAPAAIVGFATGGPAGAGIAAAGTLVSGSKGDTTYTPAPYSPESAMYDPTPSGIPSVMRANAPLRLSAGGAPLNLNTLLVPGLILGAILLTQRR